MKSLLPNIGKQIQKRPLLWLVGLALIIRLALVIYLVLVPQFRLGEGYLYLNLSSNLTSGHGLAINTDMFVPESPKEASAQAILQFWRQINGLYGIIVPDQPTAYVMPLYPLLLAGMRVVFDNPVIPAQVLGAITGSVLVWLIGLIALRLGGKTASVVAATLAVVHPHLIYFSWTLTPQIGFCTAMAAVLLVFIKWREAGGWGWAILMGILVGIAWLLRTEGVELLLVLAVAAIFPTRWAISWSKRFGGMVVAGVVALLLILPWGLRNLAELGDFSIATTSSGRILYEYNLLPFAPEFAWEQLPEQQHFAVLREEELARLSHPEWTAFPNFPPQTPELARNDQLTNQSLRFIAANPRVYSLLCLGRVGDFFRLTQRYQGGGMMVQLVTLGFFPIMLILGFIGLFRRLKGTLILILLCTGFFVAMVLIASGVAYRATTFDIAWLPLTGLGGAWIWEKIRGRKPQTKSDSV